VRTGKQFPLNCSTRSYVIAQLLFHKMWTTELSRTISCESGIAKFLAKPWGVVATDITNGRMRGLFAHNIPSLFSFLKTKANSPTLRLPGIGRGVKPGRPGAGRNVEWTRRIPIA